MTDDLPALPKPEPVGRFVPIALARPAITAALGIDGGAIFQVIAVENLGLSPSVIGIAFGLGLLSLPLQLWAARMPFRLAKRNIQVFFVIAAIQCLVLAGLIAMKATGGFAATALVVTVAAEVAISVLFVTAWQPLLATRTTSRDRQRINAAWAALGKGGVAGLLIAFSMVEATGRAFLLVGLAIVSVGLALHFGRVSIVDAAASYSPHREVSAGEVARNEPPPRMPAPIWWILASFAALNMAGLPLWLVYLSEVIWPTVNLSLIGAIQTLALVAALLAWRPTVRDVRWRAIIGTLLAVAGSIALAGVGQVSGPPTAAHYTVIIITVLMTFGATYASLALLEMAHRLVEGDKAVVRVFTVIDVVDSSALQLGLFLSGLLVASSVSDSPWSPYVVFVLGMSVVALAAVTRTAFLSSRR